MFHLVSFSYPRSARLTLIPYKETVDLHPPVSDFLPPLP